MSDRGSSPAACRRLLKTALGRLKAPHGDRQAHPRGSAVDVLVGTILSQNTSGANSSAGFRRLKQRFASWSDAADARTREIEACIRVSGLGRTKAPRIRRILRRIRADRGRISLAHVRKMNPDRAYEYLLAFDGVGPKTALCTLLFGFGMPVFPVDTHIFRIARRLGVMAESVPFARAHQALGPLIAPADRYAMHVLLIAHGRATCKAQRPRCEDCRLLNLCPTGTRRLEARA
jgi:endonuclease-3